MRVAFYALGNGHGSAMRAMAVARALQEPVYRPPESPARGATATHCLVLTTPTLQPWARLARVPSAAAPPMALRDAQMLTDWVADSLRDFAPDLLVVDTYPLGALAELSGRVAALAPRRALLAPWVSPSYWLRPDVSRAIAQDYDAVILCEPPADALAPLLSTHRCVERVGPVLFVRPQDVETSTSGRQVFGIHELSRTVLGVGSGDAATERGQLDALVAASRTPGARFDVLFMAHHLPPTESAGVRVMQTFPAGAWLRACPVAVAAAGYASYYEIVQAGVPAVFRPLPRPLDDQAGRARGERGLVSIAPHAVVEDDAALGASIGPLLERELRRRARSKGSLALDVETRVVAVDGAADVAHALRRIGA